MRRHSFLSITLIASALILGVSPAQAASKLPIESLIRKESTRIEQTRSYLMGIRTSKGLNADHDFELANLITDETGKAHFRFQQLYQGVKVWGGQVIAHVDQQGRQLNPTTALKAGIGISTQPAYSPSEVLRIVKEDLNPKGPFVYTPAIELMVLPIEEQRIRQGREHVQSLNAMDIEDVVVDYRLTYYVSVQLENNLDPLTSMDYMVDALSGRILKKWSSLTQVDARGTGYGKYNGTITLFTNTTSSGYELRDMTRGNSGNYVTNMNRGTSGNGSIFTDSDNNWGDGQTYDPNQSTTSANGQTVAVDAAYGQQATWDMLKNMFGRNGWDNTGRASYIRVHYGNASADAFFSSGCWCVALGDANPSWGLSDATSVQTVAHELGHAFCAGSANLVYSGEPGGLNEANSDITCAAAFFYVKQMGGTGNALPSSASQSDVCWNLFHEEGNPLRYMTKPSKDGKSKDAWYSGLGNIDVHYSSGPGNRMFFFLTSGASNISSSDYFSSYTPNGFSGVGPDKAYRIWYKAITSYMTTSTNYSGAREACLNAASDLFGANSSEYNAVMNAFAAINVGQAAPAGISVSISPSSVSLNGGGTQQFTAQVFGSSNNSVTWTCTGGSINSNGFYIAPTTAGNFTVQATSVADPSKWATANVTVTGTQTITVQITPTSASLLTGESKQFEASVSGTSNTSVIWACSGGSISQSGLYQAPNTAGTYSVRVTSAEDGTKYAEATVTVSSSQGIQVTVNPPSISLMPRGRTQFTANVTGTNNRAVIWTATAGYLTQTGLYYAPLENGTYRIRATSAADPSKYGESIVTVGNVQEISVVITPGSCTLSPNAGQQFTAVVMGSSNSNVVWTATGGIVNSSGYYTAPSTPGTYQVRATSVADSNKFAEATITVTSQQNISVVLNPMSVDLLLNGTQQFNATVSGTSNQGITWSCSGGSVTQSGFYSAPGIPGTYTVRATSNADPNQFAEAVVTVVNGGQTISVTVSPERTTIRIGSMTQFNATVQGSPNQSVSWTCTGGTISSNGTFTAGLRMGNFRVRATSVADPSKYAEATVQITR